jgi:small subunit ribosomal protein S12
MSTTFNTITRKEWIEGYKMREQHFLGAPKKRVRIHKLRSLPQQRGVVLKTLIKRPRKPNSANRKCVLVRLADGREVIAYVPGIGHNLQEHSVVLVNAKPVRDVPGLRARCVRGAYDLPHVVKTRRPKKSYMTFLETDKGEE